MHALASKMVTDDLGLAWICSRVTASAATAVGPDGHAWADVAATRLSASKPEPSTKSSSGPPTED